MTRTRVVAPSKHLFHDHQTERIVVHHQNAQSGRKIFRSSFLWHVEHGFTLHVPSRTRCEPVSIRCRSTPIHTPRSSSPDVPPVRSHRRRCLSFRRQASIPTGRDRGVGFSVGAGRVSRSPIGTTLGFEPVTHPFLKPIEIFVFRKVRKDRNPYGLSGSEKGSRDPTMHRRTHDGVALDPSYELEDVERRCIRHEVSKIWDPFQRFPWVPYPLQTGSTGLRSIVSGHSSRGTLEQGKEEIEICP